MKRKYKVIGVMGPSDTATVKEMRCARQLGRLIAEHGWVLLTGGVKAGVMDAANRGAKEAGGLTIGIIPRLESKIASGVDIPIITDLGSARNNMNVLSCDIVIACGMSAGTGSEVCLALQPRASKHVILLNAGATAKDFFRSLRPELVHVASSPTNAVALVKKLLRI